MIQYTKKQEAPIGEAKRSAVQVNSTIAADIIDVINGDLASNRLDLMTAGLVLCRSCSILLHFEAH